MKQVVQDQQVEQEEVVVIDNESDAEDDPIGNFTRCDTIELASKLEPLIIKYGSTFSGSTLDLTCLLCRFHGDLHCEDSINSKQVTLEAFFRHATSNL